MGLAAIVGGTAGRWLFVNHVTYNEENLLAILIKYGGKIAIYLLRYFMENKILRTIVKNVRMIQ